MVHRQSVLQFLHDNRNFHTGTSPHAQLRIKVRVTLQRYGLFRQVTERYDSIKGTSCPIFIALSTPTHNTPSGNWQVKRYNVKHSKSRTTQIIPRSHSYCLSLPLCLEWYNRSITPRVHSGVTKRIQCRLLYWRLNKCVNHRLECESSFNTHLSHSRQWFNIHKHSNCVQTILHWSTVSWKNFQTTE